MHEHSASNPTKMPKVTFPAFRGCLVFGTIRRGGISRDQKPEPGVYAAGAEIRASPGSVIRSDTTGTRRGCRIRGAALCGTAGVFRRNRPRVPASRLRATPSGGPRGLFVLFSTGPDFGGAWGVAG